MKKNICYSIVIAMFITLGFATVSANSVTGGINNKADCLAYKGINWNASWDEKNNQCLFMENLSLNMKKTYSSKKEFLEAEGKTCENATDGINTHFIKDGEVVVSTIIGYPANFTPEWKCIKEKETFNMDTCKVWTDGCNTLSKTENGDIISTMAYCPKEDLKPLKCLDKKVLTKEEFTRENTNTCEVASDGVNTFNNVNGEFVIRTKVGYPKNFVADWSCIKEKEIKITENNESLFSNLNKELGNFTITKIVNLLRDFNTKFSKLDDNQKNKKLSEVRKNIKEAKMKIILRNPADKPLPFFDAFEYNVISYLDLLFQKMYK